MKSIDYPLQLYSWEISSCIYCTRTELGRTSFTHRAAVAWNTLQLTLPDVIKQHDNPETFKGGL